MTTDRAERRRQHNAKRKALKAQSAAVKRENQQKHKRRLDELKHGRDEARHAPRLLARGAWIERQRTVEYLKHLIATCDLDELTIDDVVKGISTEEHWQLSRDKAAAIAQQSTQGDAHDDQESEAAHDGGTSAGGV